MSLTKVSYSMIAGEVVSILDFGADSTGVVDCGPAIVAAIASLPSGGSIFFPSGIYSLTNTSNAVCSTNNINFIGAGASSIIRATGTFTTTETPLLSISAENCSVKNLSFDNDGASLTTISAPTGGTTFNYKNNVVAITVSKKNCSIESCFITGYQYGITASTTSLLTVNNNNITSCGKGFAAFYIVDGVQFINNICKNVGPTGGVTFPSCKNIIVTSNNIFAAGSTGINPGGSSGAFNIINAVITSNIVYAQNAIVCENGGFNITISDNQCYVTELSPNGTGIGVNTNVAGSGNISYITITNNIIRAAGQESLPNGATSASLDLIYAEGIKVSRGAGTNSPLYNVRGINIIGNQIYNATNGIAVSDGEGTFVLRDVIINDNLVFACAQGIGCSQIGNIIAKNNTLRGYGATLQSGTVGFNLASVVGLFDSNTTMSFFNSTYVGGHYALSNSTITIVNPTAIAAPSSTFGNLLTQPASTPNNTISYFVNGGYGGVLASGTTLTTTLNNQYYDVSGTASIFNMTLPFGSNGNVQYGTVIYLKCLSTCTFKQTSGGNPYEFAMVGGADVTASANQLFGFLLQSDQRFHQIFTSIS